MIGHSRNIFVVLGLVLVSGAHTPVYAKVSEVPLNSASPEALRELLGDEAFDDVSKPLETKPKKERTSRPLSLMEDGGLMSATMSMEDSPPPADVQDSPAADPADAFEVLSEADIPSQPPQEPSWIKRFFGK